MAKISVSFDDELYARVRGAAGENGVSGWLAAAALGRLRAEALLDVAEEIGGATGGPYTPDELAAARECVGSSSTPVR